MYPSSKFAWRLRFRVLVLGTKEKVKKEKEVSKY
jgi:hypothetical protein